MCRLLKLSRSALNKAALKGRIPSVMRGKHRLYPAAAILLLSNSGPARLDEGQRDARAIELIDEGAKDADIIRALKLPLERVRALRSATESERPPGAPSYEVEAPPDVTAIYEKIENGFLKRRAELAERRRAALAPPPLPRLGRPPKKKDENA